jgi:hypothetical protein
MIQRAAKAALRQDKRPLRSDAEYVACTFAEHH